MNNWTTVGINAKNMQSLFLHSVFHAVLAASFMFISRADDVMAGYMSLACQAMCPWREFVRPRQSEIDGSGGWQCPSWWTLRSAFQQWLTWRSLLTFSEPRHTKLFTLLRAQFSSMWYTPTTRSCLCRWHTLKSRCLASMSFSPPLPPCNRVCVCAFCLMLL